MRETWPHTFANEGEAFVYHDAIAGDSSPPHDRLCAIGASMSYIVFIPRSYSNRERDGFYI